MFLPEFQQVVPRNRFKRLRGADVRIAVRIVRAVKRYPHHTRCYGERIVLFLDKEGLPLFANALALGRRKSRMQRYVGQ